MLIRAPKLGQFMLEPDPGTAPFWQSLIEQGAVATGDPLRPYYIPPPKPEFKIEVSPQISPVFTQVQDSPGTVTAVTTTQIDELEIAPSGALLAPPVLLPPIEPVVIEPFPVEAIATGDPLRPYVPVPVQPVTIDQPAPAMIPFAAPAAPLPRESMLPQEIAAFADQNWPLIIGAVIAVGGVAYFALRKGT